MDVINWWGSQIPMAYSPTEWFIIWSEACVSGFQRKLWLSSCFVVFWSLWDHRNKLVFENKKMNWIELAYLIKMRVGFWMKGWCPECPYSPLDLTRNLRECVNGGRNRLLKEIRIGSDLHKTSGNGMLMALQRANLVQLALGEF
jgi:hypothetical protein